MAIFAIDENDPRPLYEQLASRVKEQIRFGLLGPGDELPSVRELAAELGMNLHTVRHAYKQLEAEGIVVVRLGRRARIASRPKKRVRPEEVEVALNPILEQLVNEIWRLGLSDEEALKRVQKSLKGARKDKRR